jgi:hypothetical protein
MAQNSISHLDGRRFVAAPGKEERTFGIHSLYNLNDAVGFFFFFANLSPNKAPYI